MIRKSFPRARAFGIILVLVGCSLLVGCSGGKADVTGTVKYKGTPLKGGTVTFVAADGPSFTGFIKEDGTYTIPNITSGKYKVCVETESLRAKNPAAAAGMGMTSAKGFGPPKGAGPPDIVADAKSGKLKNAPPANATITPPPAGQGQMQDGLTQMVENAKKYVEIPNTYSKPETTTLSFDAGSGHQTFDIDLQ